jgi:hypothetical protein
MECICICLFRCFFQSYVFPQVSHAYRGFLISFSTLSANRTSSSSLHGLNTGSSFIRCRFRYSFSAFSAAATSSCSSISLNSATSSYFRFSDRISLIGTLLPTGYFFSKYLKKCSDMFDKKKT